MIDLRNDLAKARDAWMASDEGKKALQGEARWQYLSNRLKSAFIAGWNAKEKAGEKARKRK